MISRQSSVLSFQLSLLNTFGQIKLPVLATQKRMDTDDGRNRQSAMNVWKQLRAPFQVLLHDVVWHPKRIDLEQNQVPMAAKQPVRNGRHLMGIGTMNEAFRFERSG